MFLARIEGLLLYKNSVTKFNAFCGPYGPFHTKQTRCGVSRALLLACLCKHVMILNVKDSGKMQRSDGALTCLLTEGKRDFHKAFKCLIHVFEMSLSINSNSSSVLMSV